MSELAGLAARVEAREVPVAVVGLGYVGLPAACILATTGFRVLGVDTKADRVASIARGENPIEGDEPGLSEMLAQAVGAGRLQTTTDPDALGEARVILICVDTPVDTDHRPRYEALRAACAAIAPRLIAGALVIVESTISPGTMEAVVIPALEAGSGLRAGDDLGVGHCPERVMPGRLLLNMRTMARVLGASDPETARAMRALYSSFVEGQLDEASLLTAELVKTAENAYRDVQIAFANQLALVCEAAGGDVWRVRELVNRSPGRNVLLPGPGVGGHCIPKDPWLLAAPLGEGAEGSLLASARGLNDAMPGRAAGIVLAELRAQGIESPRVAVLGYSYLENSDDTRNSPTVPFLEALRAAGATYAVHDPWVEEFRGDLWEVVRGCDAATILVAHDEYRGMDLGRLREALGHPVVIDTRAVLDAGAAASAGLLYRRLGSPPPAVPAHRDA